MKWRSEPFVLDDGTTATVEQLAEHGPAVIVFVRHLGCAFCKQQVSELRNESIPNLYFVAPSELPSVKVFRNQLNLEQRVIADPEKHLFKAMAFTRGTMGSFVNPTVIAKGFQAIKQGFRNGVPEGDPMQLGGAVIVDRSGEILWRQPSKDAADIISPETIRAALKEVGAKTA
ncbi:MAG: AhpC/TSA family protein [Fimbriimonadaceae bacterium]